MLFASNPFFPLIYQPISYNSFPFATTGHHERPSFLPPPLPSLNPCPPCGRRSTPTLGHRDCTRHHYRHCYRYTLSDNVGGSSGPSRHQLPLVLLGVCASNSHSDLQTHKLEDDRYALRPHGRMRAGKLYRFPTRCKLRRGLALRWRSIHSQRGLRYRG